MPAHDATILLVEDDAAQRSLLTRFLAEHGFRVHAVASAAEARQEIDEHAPAFVLTDYNLEGNPDGDDGLAVLLYK